MIVILLAVIGMILLIVGRLPVSFRRAIKGIRARLVGLVLILPLLLLYLIGFVIGFMSGFTRQELNPLGFSYFVGVVQLPLILLGLLLAFAITYWPQRRRTARKADDDLAALYPGQAGESLTPGQAAFQLGLSDSKLQQLISDGSLILIESNGTTFLDKGSFDSFMLCQKGAQAAKNGQIEGALIDFDEAVKLNARSVRARFLRGKAYLGLGYYAEAYIDLQYVFNSGQKYPQIDELLVRTRLALRTNSGAKKWTVKRERSVFVTDLASGPIFVVASLIVCVLAVLLSLPAMNNFSSDHCLYGAECSAPNNTAAVAYNQTQARYIATQTEANATEFAVLNAQGTRTAISVAAQHAALSAEATSTGIANSQIRSTDATAYTIQATATTAFYSSAATMSRNQVAAADTAESPLSGKLLILSDTNLYELNPNENDLTPFPLQSRSSKLQLGPIVQAAWVGDGTRILFSASGLVFLANADGTSPKQITKSTATVKMSPNGKNIILFDGSTLKIVRARANQIPRVFYDVNFDERIMSVDWSPDSQKLAYCLQSKTKPGLYVTSLDKPQPRLLAATKVNCTLSWSPDGQTIAYCSPDYHTAGLYVVGLSQPVPRLLWAVDGDCEPVWSPDGKYIAFRTRHYDDLEHSSYYGQLLLVSADGSETRILFTGSNQDWTTSLPSWSADGKHLAFATQAQGAAVFIVDIDSGQLHNVSQQALHSLYVPDVSWGP